MFACPEICSLLVGIFCRLLFAQRRIAGGHGADVMVDGPYIRQRPSLKPKPTILDDQIVRLEENVSVYVHDYLLNDVLLPYLNRLCIFAIAEQTFHGHLCSDSFVTSLFHPTGFPSLLFFLLYIFSQARAYLQLGIRHPPQYLSNS